MKNHFKLLFIILLVSISFTKQQLFAQFTITGHVYYSDSQEPVTKGNVYILEYDSYSGLATLFDSTVLNRDGSYNLVTWHSDSILICSGWLPEIGNEDHVLTYYPSTVNWENAHKIFPPDNPVNIDIYVQKIIPLPDNSYISGTITILDSNSNVIPLTGAIVIASQDTVFRSTAISDSSGNYTLDSLSVGTFTIMVEKLGFDQDSTSVYVGGNSISSTNFKLNRKRTHRDYHNLSNLLINKFYLSQNFPNPFNPITKIRFVIPVSENNGSEIELNVYDILGKKVRTLAKAVLKPGEYEVSWDASNYATGIYFYELKSDNFRSVKKMILVK